MAQFQKLLLAIDLNSESDLLLNRVQQLCSDDSEKLHVVHVLKQPMHVSGNFGNPCGRDAYDQRIFDQTQLRIREILQRHGIRIPVERIYLAHGEPAFEIKKLAARIDADLVIVGLHCKDSDWMQLPGTTTNCVIQGASSNVMAVKV